MEKVGLWNISFLGYRDLVIALYISFKEKKRKEEKNTRDTDVSGWRFEGVAAFVSPQIKCSGFMAR